MSSTRHSSLQGLWAKKSKMNTASSVGGEGVQGSPCKAPGVGVPPEWLTEQVHARAKNNEHLTAAGCRLTIVELQALGLRDGPASTVGMMKHW